MVIINKNHACTLVANKPCHKHVQTWRNMHAISSAILSSDASVAHSYHDCCCVGSVLGHPGTEAREPDDGGPPRDSVRARRQSAQVTRHPGHRQEHQL